MQLYIIYNCGVDSAILLYFDFFFIISLENYVLGCEQAFILYAGCHYKSMPSIDKRCALRFRSRSSALLVSPEQARF